MQALHATMKYTNLGTSSLKISRLCLGCMSYGDSKRGHHSWTLSEETGRPFIARALELGINFFDTANVYSNGSSEAILGRALRDFAKRDEVVIASKVGLPRGIQPKGPSLSRSVIFAEVDKSLARLGTDYLDLYQVHRWDYHTPIEETLEALHDLVIAGKVRYIGASSMHAWQFCKALHLADMHHWTRFISMQNHLSLLNREEEREMVGLCESEGIGLIPWSPLARGRLARDWGRNTNRARTDEVGNKLYTGFEEADRQIVERVGQVAAAYGVSRAQIALAWLLHKPAISAPIIGATQPHHLEDAVSAISVQLTAQDIRYLEECYVPHAPIGFK